MIDRFTQVQFEAALPKHKVTRQPLWSSRGLVDGEYVYDVKVSEFARIVVRSSIGIDGVAADTGEDSIRLWVEVARADGTWQPLKKIDAYTTRVVGWADRMTEKMRELWAVAIRVKLAVPVCQRCGQRHTAWITKDGLNAGRPASKCFTCSSGFTWLDAPPPKAETKRVLDDDDAEEYRGLMKEVDEVVNVALAAKPLVVMLNVGQKAAVEAPLDKPVCVIAGPGSGKTKVFAERYKWLCDHGVKPEYILAVTFSNPMSQELRERIVTLVPEVAGTQAESQLCSIHAACNRIAVAEGFARKIPDKPWDIKNKIREISVKHWPSEKEGDPEARPTWNEIASVDNSLKYHGLEREYWRDRLIERFGDFHGPRLYKTLVEFNDWMHAEGMWDFRDMLYDVEMRLKHDGALRARWQDHYRYVMVDEGQDTNWQSMRILTTLAAPHDCLFIVGDGDQTLFRFTGATPDINLYDGYDSRYPEGERRMLTVNYRSTQEIVERANQMIRYNYDDRGGMYPANLRKELTAREGAPRGSTIGFGMYESQDEEAASIVALCIELLAAGRAPGDIFVITRTKGQLGYLEGPMTRAALPFINVTGGSFWQMKHVKDVLAYMRLAYNPNDTDAMNRVYNIASNRMTDRYGDYCPTRWLGRQWLEAAGAGYEREKILATAWQRRAWSKGVEDFVDLMDTLQEQAATNTLADVLRAVLDDCYVKHLKHEEGIEGDEGIGKLDDLNNVVAIAQSYDFAGFMAMVEKAIQAAEDAKSKNWGQYIVLSTTHRVKGMERAIVISPGWCEGTLTTKYSTTPIGLIPHTYSMTEPPASGVLGLRTQNSMEDERCIAYVIVTRAKEAVYLSGSYTLGYGGSLGPSRFVKEMGLVGRHEDMVTNDSGGELDLEREDLDV